MNGRTPDARAVLLLRAPAGVIDDLAPLSPTAFNRVLVLAARSHGGSLGALVGLSGPELADALPELPDPEHVARLLARDAQLAFALERLDAEGVWTLTCADEGYPERLRQRLADRRPAVLFGVGDPALLGRTALGVVGSRDVDEAGQAFAAWLGSRAATEGLTVVSGGARGTDRIAMEAALQAGGTAVGVLADGLLRASRTRDTRARLLDGTLALVTPFAPTARFQTWAAMERNRIVYALAGATVVAATAEASGGTWAGAVEALERGYGPVWVRQDADAPPGNRALAARGARPLERARAAAVPLSALLAAPEPPARGPAQPALF